MSFSKLTLAFSPGNSWKLRIPSQVSSIDGVYTDQKNLIGDFDSEESSPFSTALTMEFFCLHLISTNLDISDFQHAGVFFPYSILVLERYLVVFERFPIFLLLAWRRVLSQLPCSLQTKDPQEQQNKEGIPGTHSLSFPWYRRRNAEHRVLS